MKGAIARGDSRASASGPFGRSVLTRIWLTPTILFVANQSRAWRGLLTLRSLRECTTDLPDNRSDRQTSARENLCLPNLWGREVVRVPAHPNSAIRVDEISG